MDSDLYLNRAENEIKLARIVFAVSKDQSMQVEVFGEKYPDTYYSAVITHSYYAIFYAAKAYLLTKGVVITPPEEHRKTYDALKGRVDSGELDVDLLRLYNEALVRAETLLGILKSEKKKRGDYTYQTLPQANQAPAAESVKNAETFYKHLRALTTK